MMNDLNILTETDVTGILKNLDARLTKLESLMSSAGVSSLSDNETTIHTISQEDESELELRIGQYWFPKLGILVFIIGVVFSLTLPFEGVAAILPSLFGYILALTILALAQLTRKSFKELNGYLIGGSAAIAYLSTLRLYFFGSENMVNSWVLELLGLFFVVSTTIWYAVRNKSVILTCFGIFLGYFTALTMKEPALLFLIVLTMSVISVLLTLKYNWQTLLIFSTVLAYLTHLVWYVSNPFTINTIELLKHSNINLSLILGYLSVLSLGILYRKENSSEEPADILSSFINSAGGYGLFLIITLINPSAYFAVMHLTAAVVFLIIATAFWIREKSQYSTFIYAMTGYAALSVAIIFQFDKTWSLILLCWQSLIVLSMAIWFRSKFIIVANFIIFIIVALSYFAAHLIFGPEALSFGIVALTSARILNWQKRRVDLQTESLRNSYLVMALVWIPYLFHCVLPSIYVGLSLLSLALVYFGVSRLLKNIKYRWMAVMTMLITVFYLMIFGITNADTTYKIISFLAAGVVLIITSAIFSRLKMKSPNNLSH